MVFQRIDDHDRDCDENDDEQGHAMKDDHHHQLHPYPLPPISTVTDAAAWTTSTNTSTGTISNSNSSTSSSSSSLPFYHRPRVLYGTVFIWLSIAGGRFLAPLLQHEGSFQSSSSSSSSNTSTSGDGGNGGTFDIGLILAIQQLVGIPCNTYASHITDLYVQRYQNPHLRAIILLGGCFVANMSFLLMGVRHLYETDDVNANHTDGFQHHVMYYMILRIIFAISLSFVLPVLDGLCVHHISNVPTTTFTTLKTTTATNGSDRHNQSESSSNKNSYGKERLWGAITWAVTNVVIGPLYDHYGFEISYLASIGAFLLVSLSVYLYIQQPLPAVSIDTKFASSSPTKTKRTKSGAYTELETSTRGVDRDDDDDEPTISMDDDDDDDNDRTTNVERTDSVVYSKIELLQCLLFSSPDHHRHDQSSRSTGRTSHNDGENVDSVPPTWIPPPTSPRVYYFGSVFILSIIILSFGRIIVESLIFLYFEELGSSYFIMGCTVVLTVLFEIPVFSISSALLQYFGTSALLRIAMICYIVRVIGYSFIPNGHVQYAFILEPLHGVTYACSQTAVVDFVHHRTPPGYESTGQSFVYLFRGLGSVLGLIIGGYMTDVIGARMVYRIAAMIVSIGCLSLSAVQSQPSPPATLESSTQRRATDNQDERRRCPESMTDDESIEMVRSIT